MPLTLTIINPATLTPVPAMSSVIDFGRVVIGRGQDSDWILPDPEKTLSRKHCYIEYQDGAYCLTDTSTHGVFINQSIQAVGKGRSIRLQDGDIISLGRYDIRVSITLAAPSTPAAGEEARRPITPAPVVGSAPFSLDELLPPAPKHSSPTPEPALPDEVDLGDWLEAPGGAHPVTEELIPEELDLEKFLQTPEGAPSVSNEIIPEELDIAQLLAEPESAPSVPDEIIPEELDLMESIEEAAPAATSPSAPKNRSPERDFFRPPAPRSERSHTEQTPPPELDLPSSSVPQLTAPAASSAPMATVATDEAATQAFLTGAGLPPDLPLGSSASTLMRELGLIFRQIVQGLMDILRARYDIKKTIGIRNLTTIGPRENNPLKMTTDVDKAMRLLLGPRDPAYLPTVQALEESLTDIKVHEMAMVAGMQNSLQYLLKRFDPEVLAARLGRSSLLDTVLPAYRKARYWEVYTVLYAEIAKEAEEDVWIVLGREFDRAYEKLARNRPKED
ncbi:MAG: type VI secretion system-associated FHA domain protein TagH [Candidatus Competibacteraceae bacterium]